MDDEIWITRDGRHIAVGDMSEQHVRNALRLMLSNKRVREEVLSLRDDDAMLGNTWVEEE